jgi:predicted nucleic acid-binding protein
MLDALLLIPIRLVPLDRGLAGDAADLSHETGAGLMDAIVATTALASNAVVLTADPDFAALKSVVRMEFVR